MPPRISASLSCAAREGTFTSISPSLSLSLSLAIRAFSFTAPPRALGPESPNFIEVPKPAQPSFPPKQDLKGHLPVPRDVFKTRSKLPKDSKAFLDPTTPKPKKAVQPGPWSKDADYRLYKQRLAESRREALRTGVRQLRQRKDRTDAAYTRRIQAINTQRRELAMAPPREVDVLTQTSISKGIRDFLDDTLPSTPRAQFVKQRRGAYVRRLKRQQDVRKSRLHDLYVNARQFIVTEEQLDEAVETAFGTLEQPVRWDTHGESSLVGTGISPWEGGIPDGVKERLQKISGGQGVTLAKKRVQQVAEILTGGKM